MAIHTYDKRTLHEGCVLEDRERNYYDDSDFYAVVWTDGDLKEVEYNTTRFAGGGNCRVDATPQTWSEVGAYCRNRLADLIYRDVQEAARVVEKGKRVRVARGRKVPIGTEGELFWIGQTNVYGGYSKWSQRDVRKVGVATTERKDERGRYADVAWTYESNLEVANPETYESKTKSEVAESVSKMDDKRAYGLFRSYRSRSSGLAYMA